MAYIGYILEIILGAFFIWLGSFQLIATMLPHDFAMQMAEKHGAWCRENIFHLPAIREHKNGQTD